MVLELVDIHVWGVMLLSENKDEMEEMWCVSRVRRGIFEGVSIVLTSRIYLGYC